jgi:hypothetical protein
VSEEEEYKLKGKTFEEKYKYKTIRGERGTEVSAFAGVGRGDPRRIGKRGGPGNRGLPNLLMLFSEPEPEEPKKGEGRIEREAVEDAWEEGGGRLDGWEARETREEAEEEEGGEVEGWDDWDAVHPDCEGYYVEDWYEAWWAKEEGGEVEEDGEAATSDGDREDWGDWDAVHLDCEIFYLEEAYFRFWELVEIGHECPEDIFSEFVESGKISEADLEPLVFERVLGRDLPPLSSSLTPPTSSPSRSPSPRQMPILAYPPSSLSSSASSQHSPRSSIRKLKRSSKPSVDREHKMIARKEKSSDEKKMTNLEKINTEIAELRTITEFEMTLRERIEQCLAESPENHVKVSCPQFL